VSRKRIGVRARNIVVSAVVIALVAVLAVLVYVTTRNAVTTGKSVSAKDFSLLDTSLLSRNISDKPYIAAENDRLQMILDPVSLGITLVDKASGERLESVHGTEEDKLNASWKGFLGSGVSIEFFNGDSPSLERADMFNHKPEVYIENRDDGFKATIVYEKLKIALDVIAELTEDGMKVTVPADSIYEGEQYRLASVYLYPFMGATRLGEEKGYMLLPEGSGALIDLEDNKGRFRAPYSKKVYGDNIAVDREISQQYNRPNVKAPEQIIMPIFGMAHTDRKIALLGIAEEGKYNCQLLAYPNGVSTNYNWITIKYLYREDYITQVSRSSGIRAAPKEGDFRDVGVKFTVLTGEKANYSGMAEAYRNYLVENGIIEKKNTDYNIRLDFLGAESKEWIVMKTIVPMTTISQMETMLKELMEYGVKDILPTYMGWQKGGLSLSYGDNGYKVEEKLGSLRQLDTLAKELKDQGINLMLYQDFLLANTSRNYDTQSDIVKNLSKNLAKKLTNKRLYPYYYYLTPKRSLSDARKYIKKFEGTDLKGITFGSVANTLFSYFSGGNIYSRQETKKAADTMMEGFGEFSKAMIQPFDYMWKYADYYFDIPLYASNYNYVSREIPFLPMVLKGYMPYYADYANFEPNKNSFLLKMVEYGAYPSFILTWEESSELKDTNSSDIFTSNYDDFKSMVVEYYNLLKEISDKTDGTAITRHDIIADDVVKVQYENGVEILINYSNREFEYKQDMIAPQSYKVYEVN